MSNKRKERRKRILDMLSVFRKLFPSPHSELYYSKNFEFLFAVILSAQSTDKQVNIVTKKLFKKYKNLQAYANASTFELEKYLSSLGLFRSKARFLKESAKILLDKYNGKIPKSISELTKLPGVGRKTANVVLSELFHIYEGIAVDTHVKRISILFDLVDPPFTAKNIERQLMEIVPQEEWGNINSYMVLYGRYYFPSRGKITDNPLLSMIKKNEKTKE